MPTPLAALAPWLPLTSAKHDSAGSRAQRHSHPIRPYLDGHRFDPKSIKVMGIAFEMARTALRIANRDDLANEQLIANRIIGLAKTGERNPDALCGGALKSE